MAASAHPSSERHNKANNGNSTSGNNNGGGGGGGKENANCGGDASAAAAPPRKPSLHHNPGLATEWTREEQATLEDLLAKYAKECTVVRYAMVSQALRDKTVRDVALRCRWMSKKENGKRRKEDNNVSRKTKDRKEKAPDSVPNSSQVGNLPNGPPHVQPVMSTDSDDGISLKDIGGVSGLLLEQNAQALDQISANFSACKLQENINLFRQTRANILSILNDLKDAPEIMKQMPPIPVKLNEELANTILGRASFPNAP